MRELDGKISDKIRSGGLPADVNVTGQLDRKDPPPSSKSVQSAKGHGVGNGATRKRSGEGAS